MGKSVVLPVGSEGQSEVLSVGSEGHSEVDVQPVVVGR